MPSSIIIPRANELKYGIAREIPHGISDATSNMQCKRPDRKNTINVFVYRSRIDGLGRCRISLARKLLILVSGMRKNWCQNLLKVITELASKKKRKRNKKGAFARCIRNSDLPPEIAQGICICHMTKDRSPINWFVKTKTHKHN